MEHASFISLVLAATGQDVSLQETYILPGQEMGPLYGTTMSWLQCHVTFSLIRSASLPAPARDRLTNQHHRVTNQGSLTSYALTALNSSFSSLLCSPLKPVTESEKSREEVKVSRGCRGQACQIHTLVLLVDGVMGQEARLFLKRLAE